MSAPPDLPWTRDELVLALAIALPNGPAPTGHVLVERLSRELNRLDFHPGAPRPDNFRSADAVAMKVAEFAALDPKWRIGTARGKSQAVADVWAEFGTNISRVRAEAQAIRARTPSRTERPAR